MTGAEASSPRVLHVITSLALAGAEMALYRLLEGSRGSERRMAVVCLMGDDVVAERIRQLGVEVDCLGLGGPVDLFRSIGLLRQRIADFGPAVLQTWMVHADFLGAIVAGSRRGLPLVWNIRMSDRHGPDFPRATRALFRVNAVLSHRLPERILCVSHSARDVHVRMGYDAARMQVVPNGVPIPDPQPAARRWLRELIGAPTNALVVSRVARVHPMKDHATLLEAFSRLRDGVDAHLVLVGEGTAPDSRLGAALPEDLRRRLHLFGPREDVARIHAASDLAVSSSAYGEGFPNVVAEAMAAGVPVVATDVGDSALIIGDTGTVVPPRDPDALAEAIRVLLDNEERRTGLAVAARRRIVAEFSVARMVERYETVYTELAA